MADGTTYGASAASRTVARWLVLAALALAAAFAQLALRPFAPAPRWDLIACFTATATGLIGALATVRKRTFHELGGGVSALPWRPDLRAPWKGIGRLVWLMLLIFYVGTVINFSPVAARMAEERHVVRQVAVERVLSSERQSGGRGSPYYEVKVRTSIPYADGDESRTGSLDSRAPLRAGDHVWALFSPTAPGLGVFLDDDRDFLVEKAGGHGRTGSMVVYAVTLLLLPFCALVYGRPGLPGHIRSALKEGRLRRLPVRVLDSGASARDVKDLAEPKLFPQLLVEGPRGERFELLILKSVAPVEFARALADTPLALHWIGSGHQKQQGVLVFGGFYIRCTEVAPVDGTGASLFAGERPTAGAGTAGRPRRIHRFPEWDTDLHTDALGWLVVVLVLLSVIALGVGVIASVVLGVLAYLLSLAAWQMPSMTRTEELEKTRPGNAPQAEPGTQ